LNRGRGAGSQRQCSKQ